MSYAKTRSAGGAQTLAADYYTSETIFRREQERIFETHWIALGRHSDWEANSSYRLAPLGRQSTIVVKDQQGSLRALPNVCRHRGTQLLSESCGQLDRRIVCPYHSWSYDLQGRLRATPNLTPGSRVDRQELSLRNLGVAVWEGFVFANLSPRAVPLEKTLACLSGKFEGWKLERLEPVEERVYEVAANWKLLFQNYSECYHCPGLHPHLNRLTHFRNSSNDLEEGPVLGGPMEMNEGVRSMTATGRLCAAPIRGRRSTRQVLYYTIFPSFFLTLVPDYVLTHRIEPLSPDRTRLVCQWLFDPKEEQKPEFDPSEAIEFWDLTNRQDWQICEAAQRGISSPAYEPGPYADLESLLAAFDREYLRALDEGTGDGEVAARLK